MKLYVNADNHFVGTLAAAGNDRDRVVDIPTDKNGLIEMLNRLVQGSFQEGRQSVRITIEAMVRIIKDQMTEEDRELIREAVCSAPDPRIGAVVHKDSGDYEFDGVVIAVVKKLGGAERLIVEDSRGLLLIMNERQANLTPADRRG